MDLVAQGIAGGGGGQLSYNADIAAVDRFERHGLLAAHDGQAGHAFFGAFILFQMRVSPCRVPE